MSDIDHDVTTSIVIDNIDALDKTLHDLLGEKISGISGSSQGIRVHFLVPPSSDDALALRIIAEQAFIEAEKRESQESGDVL